MKSERWLLDPLRILPVLFIGQAVFWLLAMPDQPTVPFALPKYHSVEAFFRYSALLLVLTLAIWLGEWVARNQPTGQREAETSPTAHRVRLAMRLARIATVLSVIGELVYARAIVANPQLLLLAAAEGDFIRAANVAQEGTIAGVTSLANLFVVSTAIFALLWFQERLPRATRRTARRWLTFVGVMITAHGLLLGARMFILYFFAILAAAYLLTRGSRIRSRVIWLTLLSSAGLVWAGATLRDAGLYAARQNISMFSGEAQAYARDVLVQHYLAADFNNAMVLLDCPPSMTYVGSTVLWSLSPYGDEAYLRCPLIAETHGTINVLAQWWQDLGWIGLMVAAAIGAWLGATFVFAQRETHHLGVGTLAFLVSFPGIFSMLRVNYFFQSIFVFPLLLLTCVWCIKWGLRPSRVPLPAS